MNSLDMLTTSSITSIRNVWGKETLHFDLGDERVKPQ